jgi:hypothetical protein
MDCPSIACYVNGKLQVSVSFSQRISDFTKRHTRRSFGSESVRAGLKVCLEQRLDHDLHGHLGDPIFYGGDA